MGIDRRASLAWGLAVLWACEASTDDGAQVGEVVRVSAGSFTMGCVEGRDDVAGPCFEWELPPHEVTLTQPFEMMVSEVTQGMWSATMGNNPSYFGGSGLEFLEAIGDTDAGDQPARACGTDCPIEMVSWWDALAYANAVSSAAGHSPCYTLSGCTGTPGEWVDDEYGCTSVTVNSPSGHPKDCAGWRLPTAAEWEYAARAGTSLPFSGGSDVDQVAWHSGNNSPSGTKAVCTTPVPRNAWGLCDMSGNVWEWTWDWFGDYTEGSLTDPSGPASGSTRVYRGGGIIDIELSVRVADRDRYTPVGRGNDLGFRLARSVP